MPKRDISKQFLSLLDPTTDFFTYQSFAEPKNPAIQPQVLHGSLERRWATLADLNSQGSGICVTVNETDGMGRKEKNITRVRAVWQDDDDGFSGAFPLAPSIVVSSSPGKFQRYWLA